jgi:peptide/nickel transport system substrate-binding protein
MTKTGAGGFSEFWMRRVHRRNVLRAGLAGGAGLALAACGTSTQSGPSSRSQGTTGQPRLGGTLNYPITADPYNWDPSYAGAGGAASSGYHLAYNTVLGYKHGSGVAYDDLTLQPELASSWEVPDAQTFIFHLRKGVKFANLPPVNGRELVADDLKFSLDYASRSGSLAARDLPIGQYATYFEGMSGVETPDASTAKVTFKTPFVPFVNYMASSYVPVVPHEIFDQDGHFKDQVVGTGPFQLDKGSSQPGNKWVWKKNPTYWDTGKPYIDQVNWLLVKDDASAQAAFQTKQLDLLDTDLDLTSIESLTRANPAIVKYEAVAATPVHIYMSVKPGSPLADLRLRQAIGLAIDRDEFLKTLYNGKGGWPMAAAFPDTYGQAEIHSLLKRDLTQAKQLVAAAGYPNGVDIEMNYPGNYFGQIYITAIQLLQSQLKQAGINLRFTSQTYETFSTLRKQHNFIINVTSKAVSGDIDSYLYSSFYPGSRDNYTEVNDPQLTPLLVAQRQETDANKRREICREAVKRINVDQVWALGIYYGLVWALWQPRLQNYAPHFAQTLTLDTAWLNA